MLYVKSNATGLNNGTSWANAFTKLQDALAKASLCNQVWVAKGTYYPDEGVGLTNNDRTLSFALKNGIALYGGFEGTETELFMRNPQFNETILSGDIDGIAGNSGNAYHVVTATSVDSTAILDGFTIQEGFADATNYNYGGGMYNISASPMVVNCTFKGNAATTGGALFNQASSPTLTHCSFVNNRANSGGAMYNRSTVPASSNSSPVINGCSFSTNMVSIEGGAIYNDGSSGTLVNCVFTGNGAVTGAGLFNQYTNNLAIINCTFAMNSASSSGGAIYNWNNYTSQPTITNCILWNDTKGEIAGDPAIVSYSIVQLGYSTGSNIITADPLFVINGYSLMIGSPAIDAGNDAAVPAGITTDLWGGNRINGIHVDMGAYEYASAGGPPGPTKPLTITCPTDTTVAADPESCGAMVDYFESHPALVMGGKRPVTVTYSPASPTFLPVGVNIITVTATDSTGDTKTCSFKITVADTTSPKITRVSATPSVLYPPNHKMVDIEVKFNTKDCTPVTTALSISSNEAVNSIGDGNTTSDWQVINNHHVQLRAERSGKGTDRVYTITITAVDSSGNIATATIMVIVPHDKAPVTVRPGTSDLKEGAGKLQISVMPNPTASFFTINTSSASDQPLEITITDAVGRIVEARHRLAANSSIQVGQNYRPGIYQVRVIQGEQRVVVKLMKQTE